MDLLKSGGALVPPAPHFRHLFYGVLSGKKSSEALEFHVNLHY